MQRMILPTEVVTVSRYIRPMALSVIMWLELTLDSPGVVTSPIDRAPKGISWPISTSSGIFKQAVTSMKSHGGVGGLTKANAFGSREDSDREDAFGRQTRDLQGIIRDSRQDLPFSLKIWVSLGISPAATMGLGGCSTLFHPTNFGVLSLGSSFGQGGDSGMCSTSGMATPWKTSSLVKVRYHLTSFLNSSMLSANKRGLPPVGRSFCSAQYWRALAYATTFSLGISLKSQLSKIQLAYSINLC